MHLARQARASNAWQGPWHAVRNPVPRLPYRRVSEFLSWKCRDHALSQKSVVRTHSLRSTNPAGSGCYPQQRYVHLRGAERGARTEYTSAPVSLPVGFLCALRRDPFRSEQGGSEARLKAAPGLRRRMSENLTFPCSFNLLFLLIFRAIGDLSAPAFGAAASKSFTRFEISQRKSCASICFYYRTVTRHGICTSLAKALRAPPEALRRWWSPIAARADLSRQVTGQIPKASLSRPTRTALR